MIARNLAALFPLLLFSHTAQGFTLQWPVQCTLGTDCFIQNYVDHDATTAAKDFHCTSHTYDHHTGTDIRLRNLAAMRAGVAVLAAADGEVIGVRDGMEDKSIRDAHGSVEAATQALNHRECGNGVHVRHADGYRTQYCHLKQGSIAVTPGQTIHAGDVLGLVGLSGQTEFPHLHLSLWKDDVVTDPFTAQPMEAACNPSPAANLWARAIAYAPTAVLGDGVLDAIPEQAAMRDTPLARDVVPSNAQVMTYWADLMGVEAGDVLSLRLLNGQDAVVVENTKRFERPLATYFTFIGKKTHGNLAPGDYRAILTLTRSRSESNDTVIQSSRNIVVR